MLLKFKKKKPSLCFKKTPNLESYWHPIDDSRYAYFIDFEKAHLNYNPDADGYMYYHSHYGVCAHVRGDHTFVRGDLFLTFLNWNPLLELLKDQRS